MKTLKYFFSFLSLIVLSVLISCEPDPEKENVPELITKVTLTFSTVGSADVVVTATDPDGEGVQDLEVDGEISLLADKTYTLSVDLINELAEPGSAEYDITEEVSEEGDEHKFLFAWTGNVFSDPAGNGNIDNIADDVNYTGGSGSLDENGLPLGLITTWTTAASGSGTYRVVLKHQPELKTATSGFNVGDSDLDVTFDINIID